MSIYVNVNFLWENDGETRHRDEHRGSFRFASAWPAWLVPRVLPFRPALKHVLADMSLPRHKWNNIQWEFQDPYIGLIYGRYLQFRFLEWPLKYETIPNRTRRSEDLKYGFRVSHHMPLWHDQCWSTITMNVQYEYHENTWNIGFQNQQTTSPVISIYVNEIYLLPSITN